MAWSQSGFNMCCYSVTKSCLIPCNPMDFSPPGWPVLHHLPELALTHVHWVGDAIQPSHPLSPSSPFAFNLSQHQGLFPVSELFASGGQSTGASSSASVLPVNIQGWFPLGLTDLISLQTKGFSRVISNTTLGKHQFFFMVQLSHPYMTTGKTITLTIWTFFGKVVSLLFKMLSRVCRSFSSKKQVSFNFVAAVIVCSDFGAEEDKNLSLFPLFLHLFAMKWWNWIPWTLFYECWVLSQLIHSLPSPLSRNSLVPLPFLPLDVQFSSVTQLCPTLFDPTDCSLPGFPVHHQLPESAQNSCPSSQWCHPTISSSVVPFSSCLQSFPASGSFPMNQFFASGGQCTGATASAPVLPMNIQD